MIMAILTDEYSQGFLGFKMALGETPGKQWIKMIRWLELFNMDPDLLISLKKKKKQRWWRLGGSKSSAICSLWELKE